MDNQIVIEVWGDFACFTRPESKVERLSYPVPTPSAARGILSAIYSKPNEFYWQVNKIEILNPIKYISFMRNEVKCNVSDKPILVEDNRTQRQSIILKDVRYRIYATIVKQESYKGTLASLNEQALRRIRHGKCYFQPSFGCREFAAYFEESDRAREPFDENIDLGLMLYDVFDLYKFEVTKKCEPFITVFRAELKHGILEIPDFDSGKVLKPEVV